MKHTIVLHDFFRSAEGGGRLALTISTNLATDLVYGFKTKEHPFFPYENKNCKEYCLHTPQHFPFWRQLQTARAFQNKTLFLQQYNSAIYSGFYSPLAAHNCPGKNIYYCHTPIRFIYDQKNFYTKRMSPFLRPALRAFSRYLKPRYENAIAQMDVIIANSKNVQQRIKHYLGRDAIIINPPCDTNRFHWQGQGDYYLSTSRLDPLKRVDRIITAFKKMPNKKLIVASGGQEFSRLQQLATGHPHIQFSNWCSENTWQRLMGNAIATISIPKNEDFGMSPVESMSAGKPVIGVAEGGLLETVINGQTGILLPPTAQIDDICTAVINLSATRAKKMRADCRQRAKEFSQQTFLAQISKIIT